MAGNMSLIFKNVRAWRVACSARVRPPPPLFVNLSLRIPSSLHFLGVLTHNTFLRGGILNGTRGAIWTFGRSSPRTHQFSVPSGELQPFSKPQMMLRITGHFECSSIAAFAEASVGLAKWFLKLLFSHDCSTLMRWGTPLHLGLCFFGKLLKSLLQSQPKSYF